MRQHTFRPRLESLEGRLVPAGNVTARLSADALILSGDAQDNAIAVTQAAPGEFTVSSDDGTTTINGAAGPVTLKGATRDLRVQLGNGNDRLRLGSSADETLVIGRDLRVDGGAGDNSVTAFAALRVGRDVAVTNLAGNDSTQFLAPLTTGRDVSIANGDGDSATTLSPGFGTNAIGGSLWVVNGSGSDTNSVADTNVAGGVLFANGRTGPADGFTTNFFGASGSSKRLTVGGDVTFATPAGSSSNSLTDTDAGGDVTVVVGRSGTASVSIGPANVDGNVTVRGDVTILSGGAQAQVTLGDLPFGSSGGLVIGRGLQVATGGANDDISLAAVRVGRAANLSTDGGDDRVVIDDSVFARDFNLATGDGADVVRVEGQLTLALGGPTEFRGDVSVNLGKGNDTLQLGVAGDPARVVRLTGAARFDGGAGDDLRDAANVTEGKGRVTFVNFERTAPPPLFLGPTRNAVGNSVLAVVTADFNRDGKLDLVTANNDDGTLSLLLGNGDGTFRPAVTLDAGSSPQGLVVGDFNGDGRPDLAVANNFGPNGTVSVFLGNGDGTFRPRAAFAVGPQTAPVKVAVGDFNRDGRLDLVTVNRTGNNAASVSLLLGNGDGTFGAATTSALGQVGGGTDLAVGDVNGDGKLDVVATSLRALAVLIGNGDGTFQAPAVEAHSPLTSVVLGDLNRDGKLDLVLGGNDLRVRLGNGDGTFGAPAVLLSAGVGGVAVGDFNHDGILDVIATHFDSPSDAGSVFLGKGDGTFRTRLAFSPGLDDGPVAVGDFNGDGFLDAAVGNQEFASVSVLLNSRRVVG